MAQQSPYFNELVREVIGDTRSDRERAVRIHDFVRDQVRYGFTPRFDEATASETLAGGVGHCNPQTQLFVDMLRAAGIEARLHFVTISGEILQGLMSSPPSRLSHSYAEVKLEGRWVKLDSYIVDRAHAAGAVQRLLREGKRLGYGFHRAGTVEWDGRSDAFAQLADPAMILEDHGTWSSAQDFYRSAGYLHRLGPLTFSSLLTALPRPLFNLWSGLVEGQLERLRQARGEPELSAPRAAQLLPA